MPNVVMSDGNSLPTPRGLDGLPITPQPVDHTDVVNDEPPALDSQIEASLPELERLAEKTVHAMVTADNLGRPNDAVRLPIFLTAMRADPPKGAEPAKGKEMAKPFEGRSGTVREKLVKDGGGSEESERAVALGLSWLAKQQKADGGWEFDQGSKEERVAATGLALLAFLGAGEKHTDEKAKYQATVKQALGWLKKNTAVGAKAGRMTQNMYAQAIGTLALCEAYGMTKDAGLKADAQAAIDYIQKCQGPNGSWGYGLPLSLLKMSW